MQELVERHVRVRERVTGRERAVECHGRGFEMGFDGLEVVRLGGLLVLWIGSVFVVAEEGGDEQGAPCSALVSPFLSLLGWGGRRRTVSDDITDYVDEVLFLFVRAVVFS